ncbi:hypothetical protein [Erwinia sp. V71]|uniref:hypothetical protein n=1 Tax=Erwinia sp. V71 TaxID=3369424 RepID=UPI003F5FF129
MDILNKNWTPEFGRIITWFAMDKRGRIAVMVNNCFGNLPDALLSIADTECLLDQLTDYLWEESQIFTAYPPNKKGKTILDLYSATQFSHMRNEQDVACWIGARSGHEHHIREHNIPSVKGFYLYYGVEGSYPGEDYPVGYNGYTVMGDYFRFLGKVRLIRWEPFFRPVIVW